MTSRIEDRYTLYVWSYSLQRYIEYCHFTTLERVKEQIDRMIKSYNNPNRTHDWSIWKGCKRIDLKEKPYKIVHRQFKITTEQLIEEVVDEHTPSK